MGGGGPRALSDLVSRAGGDAIQRADGGATSYAALGDAVARGAEALAAHGALQGRAVAIAARDPAGFLVACLAAWRAGGVVVPCDPRGGDRAVARVLERAKPALFVREATVGGELVVERRDGARALDPRAALVLFTSGSGAEPKGVVLGGEGVAENVGAILEYLPLDARSKVAVVVPLSYSYGLVGQAMTALAAGATLLLLNDVPYAAEQVERMAALGATVLSSVPASLRLLARATLDASLHPPLSVCASAGAAIDADTVSLVRRAFPEATLFNQYGLTEASPRVAQISDRDPAFARGVSGRAVRGVELRVVGPDGAALPSGAVGDVEARGRSIMMGYLDDDEATARAFTADGWLRTRDVGQMDGDGRLTVLGRSDGVVKCAGERVSVEEVAGVLRRAPGVLDACVLATPDPELGSVLWAFVEGDDAALIAARAAARAELPPAKRPRQVRALAALPRTSSGKVALGELRAMLDEIRR